MPPLIYDEAEELVMALAATKTTLPRLSSPPASADLKALISSTTRSPIASVIRISPRVVDALSPPPNTSVLKGELATNFSALGGAPASTGLNSAPEPIPVSARKMTFLPLTKLALSESRRP